jgi:hypothetical protein
VNSFCRSAALIVLIVLIGAVVGCATAPVATLRHSELLTAQAEFNSAMNTYTSAHQNAQNLLSEWGNDQTKGQAAYSALAASDTALAAALSAIAAPTDGSAPAPVGADLASAISTTAAAAALETQFSQTPSANWNGLTDAANKTFGAQTAALYNLGIDLNSGGGASAAPSASAAPTSPLGGTLSGLVYDNARWGINATLPSGWTYGPVTEMTYTAGAILGERVSGTMSITQNGVAISSASDFGALLIAGLTQSTFAGDMLPASAGTTWSAVSQISIEGKAAFRADAVNSDGLAHITVVGLAGSGQVLILSTPDPSAIAAWIASIKISSLS